MHWWRPPKPIGTFAANWHGIRALGPATGLRTSDGLAVDNGSELVDRAKLDGLVKSQILAFYEFIKLTIGVVFNVKK